MRSRAITRVKRLLRRALELGGYSVQRIRGDTYDRDGLRSVHDHDFMQDPAFQRAYRRGVSAAGDDYRWEWRVHIGLWAAHTASKLPGDFVECGVNRGALSSAIMEALDWDSLGKRFYLMDTFSGLDARHVSDGERAAGVLELNRTGFYTGDVDAVRANFAQWKNVTFVVGAIPDTLSQVDPERVAYLHLDMNCAPPEVAAFDHFWRRMAPGGLVLLDDYAFAGHRPQKLAMDAAAAAVGVRIASLPTGQGLAIRPPH